MREEVPFLGMLTTPGPTQPFNYNWISELLKYIYKAEGKGL